MPKFSKSSLAQLETCHRDLRVLMQHVVATYDSKIIMGHRGEAEQNAAYARRNSNLKWPESKHNKTPSMAVDVVPWPKEWGGNILWNDTSRFYHFAGFVEAKAEELKAAGLMKHRVRWGGDWDMDRDHRDQRLMDLVHFELV